MSRTYQRGDMYYADLGRGVGSEQEGYRPVVIIQNNMGNKHSPTVIIAAISSRVGIKPKLPTHYYINAEDGLELPSIILLEQIRTVDKRRLTKYIGQLSKEHINGMNHALAVSIDLIRATLQSLNMCLCNACANKFRSTGAFSLRRTGAEYGVCAYCNHPIGCDYEVTPLKGESVAKKLTGQGGTANA